jgi:hypothetical protein
VYAERDGATFVSTWRRRVQGARQERAGRMSLASPAAGGALTTFARDQALPHRRLKRIGPGTTIGPGRRATPPWATASEHELSFRTGRCARWSSRPAEVGAAGSMLGLARFGWLRKLKTSTGAGSGAAASGTFLKSARPALEPGPDVAPALPNVPPPGGRTPPG